MSAARIWAFGFGSGLAPVAPGSVATLLAWPIGWLLAAVMPAAWLLALVSLLFIFGVWACGVIGRELGHADHGAMVCDEIVAFLLVLAVLPHELPWQAAAFVLFRAFDILKPPPIRYFERLYRGGFGVMFDDLLAAGYTLMVLAAAKRFFF